MRKDRGRREWTHLRAGIFQIFSLLTVAVVIFFMDDARLAIESGATLVLVAQEAGELRPRADVWIAGKPAGLVTGIRFIEKDGAEPANLEIRATLNREAARSLRRDARATIRRSGLLAPYVVDLEPGSAGQPAYDYSDTLAAEIALSIESVVALGDSLRLVLEELEPVVDGLEKDVEARDGTLAALSRSKRVFAELRSNVAALEGLSAETGSLGRLATDTALSAAMLRSRTRLERLELSAASREGPARVSAAMQGLAANLDSLRLRLDASRGTAGRALNDREIQRQARLLRARIDSVRAELARAPFRWLRLRLF